MKSTNYVDATNESLLPSALKKNENKKNFTPISHKMYEFRAVKAKHFHTSVILKK